MKDKLQGVVMLAAGLALLIWGYSISQSVSSQISQMFDGAPPTKSIYMIIIGGLSTFFGFFKLFKLR